MIQKIAREITRCGAFTVIYYKGADGERVSRFPTSVQEHARVLEIYKQDRRYNNVHNDHSAFDIGEAVREDT